ncbi:tail fiber assembly protein [Pseudomonas protegens]|uniref:tail fiber assembly protein n=1 Tax=Pseudomonas protegens TaxID=380021 RepID=UPI0005A1D871|nr:tail fiber assembly protein [Pseudomonas protegens]MBP5108652.1 tail fiber assembly protein [Pseudomonas protegens]QTU24696.1 tail fiber assembly protein [Pseudomonas protegens]QTU34225.1 tail fiber assembly protein [Pseudomonas protegens]RLO20594.1 phage tail protein [Pseudomonas protegens]VAV68340.1 phage tail protein [Pseudomonas protegens CHA0]
MFSSKSTRSFYDSTIHMSMPKDVVEIAAERHAELMAGQAAGLVIDWGKDGFPVLTDPPPPSAEDLAAVERAWRDQRLSTTDSVVTRHRDELEDGAATTLTAEQYAELQTYRRALRDWPEADKFHRTEHRPPAPVWLPEHL